jgi:hypothetical protein
MTEPGNLQPADTGFPTRAMRITGTVVALGALAATVAGSHGRLTGMASNAAVIRVAWSARPERIEQCRRLSDDELARQPAHMRTRVACEGTTARYHLDVRLDGALLDSVTVRGGGLRHDREVYLSRELQAHPGSGRLTVAFTRVDSSTSAGDERPESPPGAAGRGADSAPSGPVTGLADRGQREEDERRRRRAEAIPPALSLDTVVTLASRSVILVTYDPLARRLSAWAKTP